MSLKTEKSSHKTNLVQVFEYGALQGGTNMLQATYLFRRRIFKKRYKNSPVVVWKEDEE